MIFFGPQEFERFKSQGLIKHLGVSNFNERQIQRLLDNGQKPEVLQVNISANLNSFFYDVNPFHLDRAPRLSPAKAVGKVL